MAVEKAQADGLLLGENIRSVQSTALNTTLVSLTFLLLFSNKV